MGSHDGHRSRPCRYWLAGVILLFLGIALVLVGVFDLAWTVARYGVNCLPDPSYNFTLLCQSNHIFTYIGSPVWGGAFVIISGAVGVSMPVSAYINRSSCHSAYVLLLFISLLTTVSIAVLNALELYYGLGHFWFFVNGAMYAYDTVKLALPFSMALLSSLTLKVIVFVLFSIHCCRGRRSNYSDYSDDNGSYDGHQRDAPYRSRDYASRSWRLGRSREVQKEMEPRYPFSGGYSQWRYFDRRNYGPRRTYYN